MIEGMFFRSRENNELPDAYRPIERFKLYDDSLVSLGGNEIEIYRRSIEI